MNEKSQKLDQVDRKPTCGPLKRYQSPRLFVIAELLDATLGGSPGTCDSAGLGTTPEDPCN
jgi:hypothetical protein